MKSNRKVKVAIIDDGVVETVYVEKESVEIKQEEVPLTEAPLNKFDYPDLERSV